MTGTGPLRLLRGRAPLRGLVLVLFALTWAELGALTAAAQGPAELAGRWRAGPTRLTVQIASWGPDCGPRPRSTTLAAPGEVSVTARAGHLAFGGAVDRRTDQCWSENRTLRRQSSVRRGSSWTTRCATPRDEPKAEKGVYTLTVAGPAVLERRGVSEYDWQLNDSHCVATVTEVQRFTRSPEASTASAREAAGAPSCQPGPPVSLALRPDARRIEPGEQVCFRATLLDAAGCPTPVSPRLRLERPEGLGGTMRGRCFVAGANAATAEGTFRIIASARGLTSRASVAVQTADLSDLRAQRIGEGGEGSRAEAEAARAEEAARLAASSGRGGVSPWLVGGLVVVGLALVVLGLVVANALQARGRPGEAAPETVAQAIPAGGSPAPPSAPPDRGAGATDPAPPPTMTAPPSDAAMICPVCRVGYSGGGGVCPRDGVELLPYEVFVARHKEGAVGAAAEARRVCPTCGTKYHGETRFCGRDGSALVPLAAPPGPRTSVG